MNQGQYPNQQGMPQQGYPQQGMPQQGYPQQGMPQQGYPQPGMPQQGYPQPGMPQQGYPQPGMPQQGYPQQPPRTKKSSAKPVILVIVISAAVFLLIIFLLKVMARAILDEKLSTDITKEFLEDHNWSEQNDGSYLVFKSGAFTYYKDKNDKDNYYYTGHYKFYTGQDALDYVTEDLSDYGITKEEMQGVFDRNEKYDLSNFVCLVLENEECIIDGENTLDKTVVSPYYGFYLNDGVNKALDMANMNTGTYFYFVPED